MRVNFFGTGISVTSKQSQLKQIEDMIKRENSSYITYSNVHVVTTARKDEKLKNAVNSADIASPDGMPLVWAAKLKGVKEMERCCGPDMMQDILKMSVEKGYKNYFYGSTDETLKKMSEKLLEKYPGIKIAGMYSPPFRKLTEDEEKSIVEEINRISPDLIWVGLGAPKQEIWMLEHIAVIKRGVMLGVGAAFDFVAENQKRAPKWMSKNGLEWLYRLVMEPKRLWKRYLETNSKFLLLLFLDFLFKRKNEVVLEKELF